MNGPLVDSEGFPRNDIDIYQVRQARQTIICLQNDHKELMNQIQTMLNKYHSEISTTDPELVNRASALEPNNSEERGAGGAVIGPMDTRVIVVVNLVSPNSPAEEAVSIKRCLGVFQQMKINVKKEKSLFLSKKIKNSNPNSLYTFNSKRLSPETIVLKLIPSPRFLS